ncbi:MAG: diadenylate cyclase [Candidatus Spechtbacterales bacterium]|nr:diadenylate cyclase [Candidatus Spechtbacterales bacterium]
MLSNLFSTSSFIGEINRLTATISIGENIYLGDILDVIIVAALIYIALFFLKQTRSLLALLGIGILIALYAIAQIFNLYLTSITLQSFFGIFFIVLAIIFQEELRRFFEFLASIGTRQTQDKPVTSTSTTTKLVQAVANLAHQKHGALIVLTGSENIERHLDGGQLADAIISEHLLESIFDPSSAGHDGAVIVNKDRLLRFGVHLPLSTDFKQLQKMGTRHSAALGLSEKTDAFVIVVSEERGTISIAYKGKITTLHNPEELTKVLNKFLKEKFPEEPVSIIENMLKKNSGIKAAALGISAMVWFFSVFQAETIQRDFVLPVAYRNVPESTVISETQPNEVVVTMAGRGEAAFSRFDTSTLKITIEGSNIENGVNTINITPEMIERPFPISVINIEPERVRVRAQTFNIATGIPITVNTTGTPEEGKEIETIQVSPKDIDLLIPPGQLAPESISTESIDLNKIEKTTTTTSRLITPGNIRLTKEAKNEVKVTITIRDTEE